MARFVVREVRTPIRLTGKTVPVGSLITAGVLSAKDEADLKRIGALGPEEERDGARGVLVLFAPEPIGTGQNGPLPGAESGGAGAAAGAPVTNTPRAGEGEPAGAEPGRPAPPPAAEGMDAAAKAGASEAGAPSAATGGAPASTAKPAGKAARRGAAAAKKGN